MSRLSMVPETKFEPDAIGVGQDTAIGTASGAPGVSVALSMAGLTLVAAHADLLVIVVTAVPMLIIANAYRQLNLWNANCGASFEWVGRAISPYLGWFTGWVMLAAYVTGCVSGVLVLGPSVTAVIPTLSGSNWQDLLIALAVIAVMTVVAVAGIRLSARVQVGMAIVEYAILAGLAACGLAAELSHAPGTMPVSSGWFSPHGVTGHGSLVPGILIAIYMFSGWEGTLYVNEETRHRRVNPGRAAIFAVLILTALYSVVLTGLEGVLPAARLRQYPTTALVDAAQVIGGQGLARLTALAVLLSVVAATGTSILLTARIFYGMACYKALPGSLGDVSPRYNTPVKASILTAVLTAVVVAVYLLASSVQSAFDAIINLSGQLFGIFYILTALATIIYYRRRIFTGPGRLIFLFILPLGAAAFMAWVQYQALQGSTVPELWSLAGIALAGLVLMLHARLRLRSPFFSLPRESDPGPASTSRSGT